MSRIPVFSTLLVIAAAGLMVWLGFWQLDRRSQKEALLARYAAARTATQEIAWPQQGPYDPWFYRRAFLVCETVTDPSAIAGRSASGESGFARTVRCHRKGGGAVTVVLGWTRRPDATTPWEGGVVHGTIAPGPRLVADPPLVGLKPNARPDPSDLPNNHLAYAVQWFLFALIAVLIYLLALRKRLAA